MANLLNEQSLDTLWNYGNFYKFNNYLQLFDGDEIYEKAGNISYPAYCFGYPFYYRGQDNLFFSQAEIASLYSLYSLYNDFDIYFLYDSRPSRDYPGWSNSYYDWLNK